MRRRLNALFLSLMIRIFVILLACLLASTVMAQEVRTDVDEAIDVELPRQILSDTEANHGRISPEPAGFSLPRCEEWSTDSLRLPTLNMLGQARVGMYPIDWLGINNWDLHPGLNMNLGLSAFASFGKNARKGVGFGQYVSAMYAVPVTDRLSVAAGGWMSNVSWSHDTYRDAGLSAVIGYKFDDHWEGYLYGQKSLVNRRVPMPLYDLGRLGDRIGAAVKYNFNPSVSIQVSVERGN